MTHGGTIATEVSQTKYSHITVQTFVCCSSLCLSTSSWPVPAQQLPHLLMLPTQFQFMHIHIYAHISIYAYIFMHILHTKYSIHQYKNIHAHSHICEYMWYMHISMHSCKHILHTKYRIHKYTKYSYINRPGSREGRQIFYIIYFVKSSFLGPDMPELTPW